MLEVYSRLRASVAAIAQTMGIETSVQPKEGVSAGGVGMWMAEQPNKPRAHAQNKARQIECESDIKAPARLTFASLERLLQATHGADHQSLLQPAAVVPRPQPQPVPQLAMQPLQHINPNPTTPAQVLVPTGMYLGHGIMPLLQRLLAKILNLEFVEMQDLLPEVWLILADDDAAKCCSTW